MAKVGFILLIITLVIVLTLVTGLVDEVKHLFQAEDNDWGSDDFSTTLRDLSEESAIDCGEIGFMDDDFFSREFPSPAEKCALSALEAEKPFVMRHVRYRTDTIEYTGLVGTSEGQTYIVVLISGPLAPNRVQVTQCPSNTVEINKAVVGCQ